MQENGMIIAYPAGRGKIVQPKKRCTSLYISIPLNNHFRLHILKV